jgi:hypothetical protein
MTLPDDIQMLRMPMHSGMHAVSFSHEQLAEPLELNVPIQPGRITFVRLTRIEQQGFAFQQVLNGSESVEALTWAESGFKTNTTN